MIDCLILGDSLGVGVSVFRQECVKVAEVGVSSTKFLTRYSTLPPSKAVLISLGSNDSDRTEENLTLLRGKYGSSDVTWLLPVVGGPSREAVKRVAERNGDRVIDARKYGKARDGVHPGLSGYRGIADDWIPPPSKENRK